MVNNTQGYSEVHYMRQLYHVCKTDEDFLDWCKLTECLFNIAYRYRAAPEDLKQVCKVIILANSKGTLSWEDWITVVEVMPILHCKSFHERMVKCRDNPLATPTKMFKDLISYKISINA